LFFKALFRYQLMQSLLEAPTPLPPPPPPPPPWMLFSAPLARRVFFRSLSLLPDDIDVPSWPGPYSSSSFLFFFPPPFSHTPKKEPTQLSTFAFVPPPNLFYAQFPRPPQGGTSSLLVTQSFFFWSSLPRVTFPLYFPFPPPPSENSSSPVTPPRFSSWCKDVLSTKYFLFALLVRTSLQMSLTSRLPIPIETHCIRRSGCQNHPL